MAESFSDEELARGMRWEGTEEAELQEFVNRMRATMIRLMEERHIAEARYKELRKTSIEKLRLEESERADRAERQRDEARRVAKVLAGYVADYAPLMVEADLASATKTALAYPEVKP